jgi:A/G-specific adenine glycosylase
VRELVSLSLDRRNPRKWYWAMMDLGVMLKKTYGNLTQKSSMYRKQSPFRNSNRQVRGKILKLLLESPGLSREKIIAQLNSEKKMVTYNIDKLIQEKLVQEEQGSYYIGQ